MNFIGGGETLNWLDIAIIVIMGISILFGVKRGFIKEVFTLLALILGIVVASRSYPSGAEMLSGVIHNCNVANVVSFIIIFFLMAALFTLIGILLKKLIKWVQLSWIDRIGGMAFGLLRGAIIVGVVLTIMTQYPVLGSDKWVKDASLAPFFFPFIEYLWKLIPSDLSGAVGV